MRRLLRVYSSPEASVKQTARLVHTPSSIIRRFVLVACA
jgi:hypothetical protein